MLRKFEMERAASPCIKTETEDAEQRKEEIRSGAYSEAQLEDREALLSQRRQRELRREKEELSNGAAVK